MTTDEPYFDGREMLVVHDAFRREFGALPDLVRGVASGDLDRAAVVAGHINLMAGLLHHHHQGEDDAFWPLLAERCPQEVAPLVQFMEIQHRYIAAIGEQVS